MLGTSSWMCPFFALHKANGSDPVVSQSSAVPHLFTVRVWYELLEADDWEVRMQTRHILSGETRYFREWSLLAAYLVSKLDTVGDDSYAAPC